MWNAETGFITISMRMNKIAAKDNRRFWPLLAEIPNEDKAEQLSAHLLNPETFGSDHPIPSLSLDDPAYNERGMGALGSVFPHLNFIVIKGLEKYERWELARECAIRHIYYVLDGLAPDGNSKKARCGKRICRKRRPRAMA